MRPVLLLGTEDLGRQVPGFKGDKNPDPERQDLPHGTSEFPGRQDRLDGADPTRPSQRQDRPRGPDKTYATKRTAPTRKNPTRPDPDPSSASRTRQDLPLLSKNVPSRPIPPERPRQNPGPRDRTLDP